MPKFTVSCQCSHEAEQAFKKIQDRLARDPDLRQLGGDMKFQFNPMELSGLAKGSKFSAQLQVTPQNQGSSVALQVEIPLMLSPFKGMIHSTLEKKFKEYLES